MSSTGSFYNNGVINKKFAEGEPIPDGWVKGMKPRSAEEKAKSCEKRKQTNISKYGVENPAQVKEFQDKAKQTSLERYGTENPAQSKEIKDKIKEVNLRKYGKESYSQTEEFQVKKTQTMLERYGVEHAAQSKEIQEKTKQTNLQRYGVEHASQSPIVQEKVKQTNLERRGVEYAMQSKEVQEKSKQTCLNKYGVENISQLNSTKDRVKQSFINFYGVENISQCEEIKQKKADTIFSHYGVDNPLKSEIIKEKVIQTNLEKYGTEWGLQADSVKEKIQQTNLVRYGKKSYTQTEGYLEKSKQTSLEKYGTEHPAQSKEVQEKAIQTSLEHYGCKYPTQSPEIQEKTKQTNLKRYGEEYYFQTNESKEKNKQIFLDKFGVDNPTKSPEIQEKVKQTNLERYGVEWFVLHPRYRNNSKSNAGSGPNLAFAKLLSTYGVIYQQEFSIGRYAYDFKISNTLVEVNPWATHNTIWSPFGNHEGKSENYHQQKSQVAKDNGYHCIHIFDWDNPIKIINSLLVPKEKVYARNTKVFGISKQEVREFENEYHLQGYCNGQEICLGLKDKFGNLVSIMTFGKSRYNKKYQYELLRYCSSKSVTGGAQKLFKYFIDNYNPDSIISYCDRAKFNGNVYPILGFKLLNSGSPSCHWYEPKSQKHFTDNLVRQRGFDQLMNANYGKGTSNEELLIQHGFVPIYDCGQDTYVWVK